MRTTNKIILAVILVAVMLLGIGYAAIQNITLNITGTATADPSQANFTVKFSETTSVSDASKVTAAVTDDTNATINVEGMTAKGDVETATYTVQNTSDDLSADLSVVTSNSNEEFFTTSSKLEKTSLKAGEATTLTVTVELIKTPITDTEKATIGVRLTAEPVQPGEEGTSGSSIDESGNITTTITSSGTYLPKGFREVSAATETAGLTIEDAMGNQYVWVEVPRNATVYDNIGTELDLDSMSETDLAAACGNIETELKEYATDYRPTDANSDGVLDHADTWYDGCGIASAEKYNELKNTMLKSVYENEGFYIGKYEAGTATARLDGTDELTPAVVQQNAYPYNNVTQAQAQELASEMSAGGYTSSLMFGIQWDLVMKYLESKGADQKELIKGLDAIGSTNWGNYRNSTYTITNESAKYAISANSWGWTEGAYEGEKASGTAVLLSTGASDTFSKMGIYDLAGNVFEWTLEQYTSDANSPCTNRGGNYNFGGYVHPASYRINSSTSNGTRIYGFRVSLY